DNEQHLFLVYVRLGAFCPYDLHITGVGHCIVYFSQGFTTTSILINGNSTPHFLYYINRTFGVGGQTKNLRK
ncbi:MAG: hypothetical protein IKA04_09690, partial [Alistipes sp.]|nr:hypothetical protein [Alistipes sp.]